MASDETLDDRLTELRDMFKYTYSEDIKNGVYDDVDLERLSEDAYVNAFLRHQSGHVDRAAAMMDSSMRWRKSMKLNELTEKSFPRWAHDIGAIYYRNRDKEGHRIMMFRIKKHKRDSSQLQMAKQFVAWTMDRHFRATPDQRVVVLYDMTQAGRANIDLELIKFQINCFIMYYPCFLAYMLIHEMPWVLNVFWGLVRRMLSSEQEKMVMFVRGEEIFSRIDRHQLPVQMGGTDSYEYTYTPADERNWSCNAAMTDEDGTTPGEEEDDADGAQTQQQSPRQSREKGKSLQVDSRRRASKYDRDTLKDDEPPRDSTTSSALQQRKKSKDSKGSLKDDKTPQHARIASRNPSKSSLKKADAGSVGSSTKVRHRKSEDSSHHPSITEIPPPKAGSHFSGNRLSVNPSSGLIFNVKGNNEAYEVLNLTNSEQTTMAYKVKTTSPKGYRVQPSAGILVPGASAKIVINMKEGHRESVTNDKFLVVGIMVPDDTTPEDVQSLWRAAARQPGAIQEHRLWCSTTEKIDKIQTLDKKIDDILSKQQRLERRMYQLFTFQLALALILACLGVALLLTYTLGYLPSYNTKSGGGGGSCSPVFWH